ncbi:DNA-methyltransferase [Allostreptomyces psammosilenae]|uniref:Methyltransferase n=1 Tax=Allostreptomyces psammosilenae TaxID=1892865 RepID=A0A852ZPN7_9ACTN|nr:site-specific DNA-methyltransferase [Allostreptomyces psammosilenae]NYI03447.1 site-specific DNA-methyltransferase (adenine-specific) [Allostreptomyces psammosilenae]
MPYTLHRGDARTVLAGLPDGIIDAVITDPPYNSGGRTSAERTTKTARAKYTSGDAGHTLANFPGDNRDQRSYTRWLTELLTESYRAAKKHAVAVVFTDWRQEPCTTDALQMAGWTWSGTLPWIKPASRPRKGGFKQSSEFIVWGVKESLDRSRAIYLPGHFIASQPRKGRVHITQKPIEVMREIVQIAPPGGTVLDPFTGSGTTGVAALREGRQFIGVELSDHYATIAEARLNAEENGLTQDDFILAGPGDTA